MPLIAQEDEIREVPLYLQIATRIRHKIASGELKAGDQLPSLREGERAWKVSLHTVRHAYRSLQESGLVKTSDRQGTTVIAAADSFREEYEESIEAFVARVARTAETRYGVSVIELANRLTTADRYVPEPVWVVECTDSLATSLAEQVGRWSGIEAQPWVLGSVGPIPEGVYLGTFYHYAELRAAVEGREKEPLFFGVHLDEKNLSRLAEAAEKAGKLVLLGVAGHTGAAIAEDLTRALGRSIVIDLQLTTQPLLAISGIPDGVPVVLSPENWDRLPADVQRSPRLFQLVLRPDESDLLRIAQRVGWPGATAPRARP